MRTGIIGTGRIGTVLSRILVAAGHEVVLANARGPQSLAPLLAELGPAASAVRTPEGSVMVDMMAGSPSGSETRVEVISTWRKLPTAPFRWTATSW